MNHELDLYNELTSNIDSVEYAGGDAPVSRGVGVAVSNVKGNPAFVSQFDINVTIRYYLLEFDRAAATDDWTVAKTLTAPASLPGTLQNDVAAFLFGKADSEGGFRRNNQLFPTTNWTYKTSLLVKDNDPSYEFAVSQTAGDVECVTVKSPSVYDGTASRGDVLQSYYSVVAGATSTNVDIYLAEIRIECKQVAYGTLLDATSSDRFTINNIRYKVSDSTKTAQFEKQIRLIRQSLFGKLSTDDISPAAYQKPEQFQTNIIDIPLIKGIDKESSLGTYLNYDVGEILLSIFVSTQRKVVEKVG
jgi:hypothetical protein